MTHKDYLHWVFWWTMHGFSAGSITDLEVLEEWLNKLRL